MKPKTITCSCCGPINIPNKNYSSPWEDVWVYWTAKPGRKKIKLGPTLESAKVIYDDYKETCELQYKYPDIDWSDDLEYQKNIIDGLEHNDIFVYHCGDTPIIGTIKECIDKQEAEKMIAELMKHYGFDNIKCKWKRSKMTIIPVHI